MMPQVIKSGLQKRLLLLLLAPLLLFALVSAYVDYEAAGDAALRQDQQLLRLVPLLADSVVVTGASAALLLAPDIDDFIKSRQGFAALRVSDLTGRHLAGESWIRLAWPSTQKPELHSMEEGGVVYRIVTQRINTADGEVLVQLADGSDPRQHWVRAVLLSVLLPNLVLIIAAALAVSWAVERALRPLIELKEAVERRSPRDLSAIDPDTTPAEVQPLVSALNRLFVLVNDQAEGQRRFVADAAHQLRTPLAGLQAQVEAWAQAVTASSARGSITLSVDKVLKLRGATRRTSQLANQLLALSRADASSLGAQPMQRVDLQDLCESVLPIHLDAATNKGIDLGLEAAPAQVSGHEWLLRELLGNLVDNAVKYTPAGGTVTIRCGRAATDDGLGVAYLEVEDDGPGIAESERVKAVQRFYRVPGTAGEGNGLGLAIADEIARVHGSLLQLQPGERGGLRIRLAM